MKKALIALAMLFVSGIAAAQDMPDPNDVYLDLPAYGGNGCPAGTVGAALSPDRKTLSILFDQFIAEAGRSSGKTIDRKSCNIGIPIHIPQGFSVSVIKVDYRGYVSVPRGAEARFTAEYFFAGSAGPKRSDIFSGPLDQDYMITDDLLATAFVWSRCGVDTNIRVNANVLAKTNFKREDVLATLDSADVQTGLEYHLQWRRCN